MIYHSEKFKKDLQKISLILFFPALLLLPLQVKAITASELSSKIAERNKEIDTLEAEIVAFQKDLVAIGKESETLANAIKTLDLNRKKLTADLTLTQKKIDRATLTINNLSGDIVDKGKRIAVVENGVADALRLLNRSDDESLIITLFKYKSWSGLFDSLNAAAVTREDFRNHAKELEELKTSLEKDKAETESARAELQRYRTDLSYQKQLLDQNRTEKDKLLKETKAKESEYQKLLDERQAKRDAFAAELFQYESQLKLLVDPSSYPTPRKGILSWPLSNVFVTQYFGNTAFAQSGAYNGKGHNGVDFRATVGTPIKSAKNGVVKGTGNTDNVCPGASYGRWVLIEHENGLTTLYAHLSIVRAYQGQDVAEGEVIGYSGNTGYATGPHLHFSVFASQGVRIQAIKSRICAGTYLMPVADLKAYLNPLSYL